MKRVLFGLALLAAAAPALACDVVFVASGAVRAIVNAHGGLSMPEAQCAAVNANRLAISLTGMPVISGGKNIGWASVRIMDPDYNIVSDEGQSETIVDNNPPSQDTANKAMADAANEAIKNFDVNLAIGQVLEYRAAAQKAAHP